MTFSGNLGAPENAEQNFSAECQKLACFWLQLVKIKKWNKDRVKFELDKLTDAKQREEVRKWLNHHRPAPVAKPKPKKKGRGNTPAWIVAKHKKNPNRRAAS